MMRRNRETAVLRRHHHETDSNPFDRIVYAGTQSNRFQVLYKVRGGTMKPGQESYATLAEAVAARDANPTGEWKQRRQPVSDFGSQAWAAVTATTSTAKFRDQEEQ